MTVLELLQELRRDGHRALKHRPRDAVGTALVTLDDALRDEPPEHLPEGSAADVELLGERPLRRQLVTRSVLTRHNPLAERVVHLRRLRSHVDERNGAPRGVAQ